MHLFIHLLFTAFILFLEYSRPQTMSTAVIEKLLNFLTAVYVCGNFALDYTIDSGEVVRNGPSPNVHWKVSAFAVGKYFC